jgi:hypothetical protein
MGKVNGGGAQPDGGAVMSLDDIGLRWGSTAEASSCRTAR